MSERTPKTIFRQVAQLMDKDKDIVDRIRLHLDNPYDPVPKPMVLPSRETILEALRLLTGKRLDPISDHELQFQISRAYLESHGFKEDYLLIFEEYDSSGSRKDECDRDPDKDDQVDA